MIAVVVVVVALAAGGGVWFWQQSGDGGGGGGDLAAGADTQLTLTMEEKIPDDWTPEGDEVEMSVGSWIEGRWWTDKHLVREMPDEVVAYDPATGEAAWRLPLEGNGSCPSSREVTSEGYVAILRGDGMGSKAEKGCHQLTMVDITQGKEVWTVELEKMNPNQLVGITPIPVILGDYVHLATGDGGVHLSVADGSPTQMTLVGNCEPAAYQAIDETLISWMSCVNKERKPFYALLGWTGEMREIAWGWRHPEGGKKPVVARVLSLEPLVVVSDTRTEQEIWRVQPGKGTVDDPGEHTVLVPSDPKISRPCPASTNLTQCDHVLVGDGVLYLRERLDENGRQHGIVAVDMETGDQRWTARAEGEASLCLIDLDENGRPILFQPQEGDAAAAVVAADPKTGDLTALAGLPKVETGATGQNMVSNGDHGTGLLTWHDGTLGLLTSAVVVTKEGGGGGAGSLASLVYS